MSKKKCALSKSLTLVPLVATSLVERSLALVVGLTLLGLGSSLVLAKTDVTKLPTGFNNYLNTVANIQSYGRDKDYVVLQGRLTSYLYKDCYEFTDLAGNSIEVELDDDVDWSGVHKDQMIEILGKIERNIFRIKIEAEYYSIMELPEAEEEDAAALASYAVSAAPASPTPATAAAPANATPAAAATTTTVDTNAMAISAVATTTAATAATATTTAATAATTAATAATTSPTLAYTSSVTPVATTAAVTTATNATTATLTTTAVPVSSNDDSHNSISDARATMAPAAATTSAATTVPAIATTPATTSTLSQAESTLAPAANSLSPEGNAFSSRTSEAEVLASGSAIMAVLAAEREAKPELAPVNSAALSSTSTITPTATLTNPKVVHNCIHSHSNSATMPTQLESKNAVIQGPVVVNTVPVATQVISAER